VAKNAERVFFDANLIRGQLTTAVLLELAERRLFSPRWSQRVLGEMRDHRPDNVPAEKIDRRISEMNKAFPAAMVSGFEHHMERMQAHKGDRHVLAAAVHAKAHVLVTENDKHFSPPVTGDDAIEVERVSAFLNRYLNDHPREVIAAMEGMVARNRYEPRSMPALIDKMVTRGELAGFAHRLNAMLPAEQRGTNEKLQPSLRGQAATTKSARSAALDGMESPQGAVDAVPKTPTPGNRPPTRPDRGRGTER